MDSNTKENIKENKKIKLFVTSLGKLIDEYDEKKRIEQEKKIANENHKKDLRHKIEELMKDIENKRNLSVIEFKKLESDKSLEAGLKRCELELENLNFLKEKHDNVSKYMYELTYKKIIDTDVVNEQTDMIKDLDDNYLESQEQEQNNYETLKNDLIADIEVLQVAIKKKEEEEKKRIAEETLVKQEEEKKNEEKKEKDKLEFTEITQRFLKNTEEKYLVLVEKFKKLKEKTNNEIQDVINKGELLINEYNNLANIILNNNDKDDDIKRGVIINNKQSLNDFINNCHTYDKELDHTIEIIKNQEIRLENIYNDNNKYFNEQLGNLKIEKSELDNDIISINSNIEVLADKIINIDPINSEKKSIDELKNIINTYYEQLHTQYKSFIEKEDEKKLKDTTENKEAFDVVINDFNDKKIELKGKISILKVLLEIEKTKLSNKEKMDGYVEVINNSLPELIKYESFTSLPRIIGLIKSLGIQDDDIDNLNNNVNNLKIGVDKISNTFENIKNIIIDDITSDKLTETETLIADMNKLILEKENLEKSVHEKKEYVDEENTKTIEKKEKLIEILNNISKNILPPPPTEPVLPPSNDSVLPPPPPSDDSVLPPSDDSLIPNITAFNLSSDLTTYINKIIPGTTDDLQNVYKLDSNFINQIEQFEISLEKLNNSKTREDVVEVIGLLNAIKSTSTDIFEDFFNKTYKKTFDEFINELVVSDKHLLEVILKLLPKKASDSDVLNLAVNLLQKKAGDPEILKIAVNLINELPKKAIHEDILEIALNSLYPVVKTNIVELGLDIINIDKEKEGAVLELGLDIINTDKEKEEAVLELGLDIINTDKEKEGAVLELGLDIIKEEKLKDEAVLEMGLDIIKEGKQKEISLIDLGLDVIKEILYQRKLIQPAQELVVQKMPVPIFKQGKRILANLQSIFKNKVTRIITNIRKKINENNSIVKNLVLANKLAPEISYDSNVDMVKNLVVASKLSSEMTIDGKLKSILLASKFGRKNENLKTLVLLNKLYEYGYVTDDVLKTLKIFITLQKSEELKLIYSERIALIEVLKIVINIIAIYNAIKGKQELSDNDVIILIKEIAASIPKSNEDINKLNIDNLKTNDDDPEVKEEKPVSLSIESDEKPALKVGIDKKEPPKPMPEISEKNPNKKEGDISQLSSGNNIKPKRFPKIPKSSGTPVAAADPAAGAKPSVGEAKKGEEAKTGESKPSEGEAKKGEEAKTDESKPSEVEAKKGEEAKTDESKPSEVEGNKGEAKKGEEAKTGEAKTGDSEANKGEAKTAVNPVDEAKSAAKPPDKPADAKSTSKPPDKPADAKSTSKPSDKPADANSASKPSDKPGSKPVANQSGGSNNEINNEVFIKKTLSTIVKTLQPISEISTISLTLKSYINGFITYCINNNITNDYDNIKIEEKLLFIKRELNLIPKKGELKQFECDPKYIDIIHDEEGEKQTQLVEATGNCNLPSENEKLIGKVGDECLYYNIVNNTIRNIKT